jgi:hypothetical protein
MMKRLIFPMLLSTLMLGAACNSASKKTSEVKNVEEECYASKDKEYAKPNVKGGFGDVITRDAAVSLTEFTKSYDRKAAQTVKLKGKVLEVCEQKGCWMSLDNGSEGPMMVHFKDYAFFVPRDIKGKNVVIEGEIKSDTTSVKELKHYAADGGKSKEEIEKITEPKVELTFMASGVIVEK